MIPPRLKKMDKQVVHDHLAKLGDDLLKRGAAHVSLGDWSHGRVGINVYWGQNVDPMRPLDTCERRDWLCAAWFPTDGAWRIYGPGVPLRTERCLVHAIGERRWRFRQLEQVLGL